MELRNKRHQPEYPPDAFRTHFGSCCRAVHASALVDDLVIRRTEAQGGGQPTCANLFSNQSNMPPLATQAFNFTDRLTMNWGAHWRCRSLHMIVDVRYGGVIESRLCRNRLVGRRRRKAPEVPLDAFKTSPCDRNLPRFSGAVAKPQSVGTFNGRHANGRENSASQLGCRTVQLSRFARAQ